MSRICRACSSTSITSREITSEYKPLNGSPFTFIEVIDTCNDCKLEGDFERDPKLNNEARFDQAEAEAQLRDAGLLIENLRNEGIRMAHAERALGLPQRTMFRWKSEGITSAAYALLKVVSEFPELIDVFEEGFSAEAKRQFYWKQNKYILVTNEMKTTTNISSFEYLTLPEPIAAY